MKKVRQKRAEVMVQVIQCLPSKWEAQSSNYSTTTTKKNREREKRETSSSQGQKQLLSNVLQFFHGAILQSLPFQLMQLKDKECQHTSHLSPSKLITPLICFPVSPGKNCNLTSLWKVPISAAPAVQ
jgi:hypothetical protein